MGVALFVYLILHNYPPTKVDAKVSSYTEVASRNAVTQQITKHKLSIIAQNAAVIDSL